MHWFEGTIPTAIQRARDSGLVFLVYITGVDDMSKKMDDIWNNDRVTTICKDNCVAIKMEAKSDACGQFSQIYPVVVVPSTYFIGTNGVPLEITGGFMDPEDFIQKIETVIKLHKSKCDTTPQSPTNLIQQQEPADTSQTVDSPNNAPEQTSAGDPGSFGSPSDSVTTQQVEASSSQSTETMESEPAEASGGSPENQQPTAEEKVERAQELIEMTRAKKLKEAADKELNSELKRRKLGQEAAKLKQWQEEKERQEVAESWKKEREEARLAKERVREQIARDRAERQAKFDKEKKERHMEQERKKEAKNLAAEKASAQTEASKRETARLQFRLPDGSSINETFASSETLGTARVFLKAKIGNKYGNFSLVMTYPRREFTEENMSSSLLDLELAPSAALIIIPEANTKIEKESDNPQKDGGSKMSMSMSTVTTGEEGGFISTILYPFIMLWTFIYSFLFGAPQQPQRAPEESSPGNATHPPTTTTTSQYSSQSNQTSQDSSTLRSRATEQSKRINSKQEGNVTRFTANDDDDDMAVYNGNSTQQM